jgi:hypothetical protein
VEEYAIEFYPAIHLRVEAARRVRE